MWKSAILPDYVFDNRDPSHEMLKTKSVKSFTANNNKFYKHSLCVKILFNQPFHNTFNSVIDIDNVQYLLSVEFVIISLTLTENPCSLMSIYIQTATGLRGRSFYNLRYAISLPNMLGNLCLSGEILTCLNRRAGLRSISCVCDNLVKYYEIFVLEIMAFSSVWWV